jgi:hypothetical protein
MRKILLLLMMIASVASAHPRSDAELKALISDGAWNYDDCRHGKEFTYVPGGLLRIEIEGSAEMRWDIKNGELIETDLPGADPNTAPAQDVLTILFLTKHELLVQNKRDKSYLFMSR